MRVQTLVACICRSARADAWRRRLLPYLESPPVCDVAVGGCESLLSLTSVCRCYRKSLEVSTVRRRALQQLPAQRYAISRGQGERSPSCRGSSCGVTRRLPLWPLCHDRRTAIGDNEYGEQKPVVLLPDFVSTFAEPRGSHQVETKFIKSHVELKFTVRGTGTPGKISLNGPESQS